MKGLIQQLRKRGVARAAGLYLALVWLFLQVADVIFPVFDIPEFLVKPILYTSAAFFPIVMLFVWFYELTDEGLKRESEIPDTDFKRHFLNRYTSLFTVIVLTVALSISIFFNVKQVAQAPLDSPEQLSLLIADAVNDTGDDIFQGALEQALSIGLESAPFIFSYPRHNAQEVALQLSTHNSDLTEENARLVAIREGIQLVLLARIEKNDEGFELGLRALRAQSGEPVFDDLTRTARDDTQVLTAVAKLVDDIRASLGDLTVAEDPTRETFSTVSLDAVSFYTQAQALSRQGKNTEAAALYKRATEEDPRFGRAYSGWALSEFKLGNNELANDLWEITLGLMEGMSDRERFRTLGLYYSLVANNYQAAIENYELLVEQYPADDVGLNNLAVVYFLNRQFSEAMRVGGLVTQLYPYNTLIKENLAIYAIYAGDWERAKKEAERTLELDSNYYSAYMPLAAAYLGMADQEQAIESYERMNNFGIQATSQALEGLADVALLEGRFEEVVAMLGPAIPVDIEMNNHIGAERKTLMLALAQLSLGNLSDMSETIATVADTSHLAHQILMAQIHISAGQLEEAKDTISTLNQNLHDEYRAAADYLTGSILLQEADYSGAMDALTNSIARRDTWLARFQRGKVFASAGFYADALAEFEQCNRRIGEASAVFLDDIPTFSLTATLDYWLGMVKHELGMDREARQALEQFLALRGNQPDKQVADARKRLQALLTKL